MTVITLLSISLSMIFFHSNPVSAQYAFAIPADNARYSDVADLVIMSPVILDVSISKVQKLPPEQTAGVPANIQRAVIHADVLALIRGDKGAAAAVGVPPARGGMLSSPASAAGSVRGRDRSAARGSPALAPAGREGAGAVCAPSETIGCAARGAGRWRSAMTCSGRTSLRREVAPPA